MEGETCFNGQNDQCGGLVCGKVEGDDFRCCAEFYVSGSMAAWCKHEVGEKCYGEKPEECADTGAKCGRHNDDANDLICCKPHYKKGDDIWCKKALMEQCVVGNNQCARGSCARHNKDVTACCEDTITLDGEAWCKKAEGEQCFNGNHAECLGEGAKCAWHDSDTKRCCADADVVTIDSGAGPEVWCVKEVGERCHKGKNEECRDFAVCGRYNNRSEEYRCCDGDADAHFPHLEQTWCKHKLHEQCWDFKDENCEGTLRCGRHNESEDAMRCCEHYYQHGDDRETWCKPALHEKCMHGHAEECQGGGECGEMASGDHRCCKDKDQETGKCKFTLNEALTLESQLPVDLQHGLHADLRNVKDANGKHLFPHRSSVSMDALEIYADTETRLIGVFHTRIGPNNDPYNDLFVGVATLTLPGQVPRESDWTVEKRLFGHASMGSLKKGPDGDDIFMAYEHEGGAADGNEIRIVRYENLQKLLDADHSAVIRVEKTIPGQCSKCFDFHHSVACTGDADCKWIDGSAGSPEQCTTAATCTCTTPGELAPGNGYRCSDDYTGYCGGSEECYNPNPFKKGDWGCGCKAAGSAVPAECKAATCTCTTPGQSAPDNGYRCSDEDTGYCGGSEECYNPNPFKKGDWGCGCKAAGSVVPAECKVDDCENLGTPTIRSIKPFAGGVEIEILFHFFDYPPYNRKFKTDLPAFGTVRMLNDDGKSKPLRVAEWRGGSKLDTDVIEAMRAEGIDGKIGQRAHLPGNYFLYEAQQADAGDSNYAQLSWRIMLYQRDRKEAMLVPLNLDGLQTFANPRATVVGKILYLTFFVPSQPWSLPEESWRDGGFQSEDIPYEFVHDEQCGKPYEGQPISCDGAPWNSYDKKVVCSTCHCNQAPMTKPGSYGSGTMVFSLPWPLTLSQADIEKVTAGEPEVVVNSATRAGGAALRSVIVLALLRTFQCLANR